ncbi:MAG: translation initiation factor IF-2 [Syntrophus sp. (in: bacteria)]|nr:translation initiation factor IF-2 [Syntrophus sp. (in: bacteria)]
MSKKRVYELAKEMGIENKDLIARLDKLGLTGKSHSSSLEDSDVDRLKRDVHAAEPHEVEEKRIKSTVIRRRAVRSMVEEEQPVVPEIAAAEAAVTPPRKEGQEPQEPQEPVPPTAPAPPAPPTGKEAPAPETPSRATVIEVKKEEISQKPVETPPVQKDTAVAAAPPPLRPEGKIQPPAEMAKRPAPQTRNATIVGRKELPKPPGIRIVKDITPAPAKGAEPPPVRPDIDKPRRKGAKAPVEVVIGDKPALRKKALIKKVYDKKGVRFDVTERDDRSGKYKEEKRPAVVKMKKTEITVPKAVKRRIRIGEVIAVGELAKKMGIKAGEIIAKLMGLGLMATINQAIDSDTATLIAGEFGYQVETVAAEFEEPLLKADTPSENLKPRAPVVTIMGHVDHGKTSLLDAIRQTNVIDGEAGGITQAIGAYHVHIKNRDIVFLDTPGHEAFTAMRARGAQVTDIVILVVAADDGVMDQTVEAINHSQVAGVPIMVAINKMDKPGADPEKIKQALTQYHLVSEEWGGQTIFAEVSAKKQQGIEELLELILLQADIMELKADPDLPARGVVIEAKLDRGRGPVATVLIQKGTLKEGDAFVCKTESGRVRAMINDQGRRVRQAGPAMPVEVIGFSRVPAVSAEFVCVEDEKKARNIADYWIRKERERELSATSKITLEQLYEKIKEGAKDLNIIVKGDVQGSIEALNESLNKLSTPDIKLKIIHSSTGTITETDVMLASASNAVIIGFNVRPDSRVTEIAEQEGVEIKLYDIIYNVISDVKAAMEGLLDPVFREVVQGRAEIRDLFKITKIGTIAGCFVLDGKITRNAGLRVVRDGVVAYDGKIASLRRVKDDVREVTAGMECGIGIENFNDIHAGDILEAYVKEKVDRKL